MRYFFDTEFIEDGQTIDLISIGAVAEDGREYYAESFSCNFSRANDWVRANVLPQLRGFPAQKSRRAIADDLRKFFGESPEIWAYYADYDWVALCQLYGRMLDLPPTWPKYCRDMKQELDARGNPKVPPQLGGHHHALDDAKWVAATWMWLHSRR